MRVKIKNIKVDEETHKMIGKIGTTEEDYGDVVKRVAKDYVARNHITIE